MTLTPRELLQYLAREPINLGDNFWRLKLNRDFSDISDILNYPELTPKQQYYFAYHLTNKNIVQIIRYLELIDVAVYDLLLMLDTSDTIYLVLTAGQNPQVFREDRVLNALYQLELVNYRIVEYDIPVDVIYDGLSVLREAASHNDQYYSNEDTIVIRIYA